MQCALLTRNCRLLNLAKPRNPENPPPLKSSLHFEILDFLIFGADSPFLLNFSHFLKKLYCCCPEGICAFVYLGTFPWPLIGPNWKCYIDEEVIEVGELNIIAFAGKQDKQAGAQLKLATNQLWFSYSPAGDAYSASFGWSWKFIIFS